MNVQAFHLSPLQRATVRLPGADGDCEALLEVQADAARLRSALHGLVSEHEIFRARGVVLLQRGDSCMEVDDDFDPARCIVPVPMPEDWRWTLDTARALASPDRATDRARITLVEPRSGACAVYLQAPRLLWDAGCAPAFARLLEERLDGTARAAPLQYTDIAQTLTEMLTEGSPRQEVALGGPAARLELDFAQIGTWLQARAGELGVQPAALALALWAAFATRSGVVAAAEVGWMADGRRDPELADVLGPLEWSAPWHPAQPHDMKLRSLALLAQGFIESEELDVSAFAGGRVAPAPLHWMCGGARVQIRDLHDPAEGVRLGLRWLSNPRGTRAWLVYDTRVISPGSAQLLAASLRQWFGAALSREAGRLADIPWHVPELRDWVHGPPAMLPDSTTIPSRLARLSRQFAGRPALVSAQGTLTYEELHRRVLRYAAALVRLGVCRSDRVAVACARDQDLYLLMLGVICAGATFVPVDLAQPKARNAAILRDAKARLVVVSDRRQLGQLADDSAADGVTVDELDAMAGDAERPPGDARDAAYAIYTSGTTGVPKGVLISHASLLVYADAVTARIEAAPDERFAALASFATDLSYTSVFGALLTGRTFCVMPDAVMLDGPGFARLMRAAGVDCLKIVPGHWLALAEQALAAGVEAPLPRRAIVFGGERLTRAVIDKVRSCAPGLAIFNHYGPTETTVGVVAGRIEPGNTQETVELGTPLAHVRAQALNAFGELCPPGVEGELAFAGVAVARCYHERPAITADRFRPDPHAARPGERLYLSGDRGHLDDSRRVYFRGRLDDQLKIAGQRVELAEVSAALRAIDGVLAAEVVADLHGAQPVIRAFVRMSRHRAFEDLQQELRRVLPEGLLPATIQEVVSMPLTGSGKVDRAALLALGQARSAGREPRTEVEVSLRAQWAALLGIDAHLVGVEDDFFRLGGHSLLAARMLARVRLVFRREVSVAQFFASPTICGLAALLSQAPVAHDAGLAAGDPQRRVYPLSEGQKRLWATAQLGVPHAYNNSYRMRLVGELDVARLVRGIDIIVRRHHVLHGRIVLDEREQAALKLCPEEPAPLRVVDFTGLAPERRAAAAAELCVTTAREPFHLEREPPLRVVILRIDARTALLLVVVHHVAWDGASGGIFVREAAQLYSANGAADALPPQAIDYGDFAVAQQQWLASPQFEQGVARWLSRLADLPMLDLRGVDYGMTRGERHADLAVQLAPAVTGGLNRLAQRHSATAFMVTLTIYFLVLHRHSGQWDIPVGTSVENRGDPRLEGIIGFFVNQLVLRADLAGDPTADELLRRVRAVCSEAFGDQAVPFNTLVSRVKQARRTGRTPLYQSMFVFQGAPRAMSFGEELRVEPLAPPDAHSRFDLSLYLHEQPDGAFAGALVYDLGLLGEHRARSIASDYERLAALVAARPESRISELLGQLDNAIDREITERKFSGLRRRTGVTQ